jgi:hypothetical protein
MRRERAGLFEEHAKRRARFEGRSSMRDGCGSRRDRADAVAVVASALDQGRQSSRAPWRLVAADEEPVFAADGDLAQRSLAVVVVELQASVLALDSSSLPPIVR